MPLDGIAIYRLKHELSTAILGGRIDKIHQPTRDELLLGVRTEGKNYRLLLSASPKNARVTLTDAKRENPAQPPMFCMLLRKHLLGGRILKVSQPSLERILELHIEGRNELGDMVVYRLIAEMMGKYSNIICVNELGKIIDSIHHIDMLTSAVRAVLPGLTYEAPPMGERKNPLTLTEGELLGILTAIPEGEKLSDALIARFVGMSPLASREIVYRAYGDSNIFKGEATDLSPLLEEFTAFFNRLLEQKEPSFLMFGEKGGLVDFSAYSITQYEGARKEEARESLTSAMEEFYESRDRAERLSSLGADLLKKVKNDLARLYKKLILHENTLRDASSREKLRIKGELITANLYRIHDGDEVLECENYYEEDAPLIKITLDPTLSPSMNAQKYYLRYQKEKRAEEKASEQKAICEEEIRYLESVKESLENADSEQTLREIRAELERSGYLRPRNMKGKKVKEIKVSEPLLVEYEGYQIYVGRNNLQNDLLTLKMSRANDLWLHAKNVAASHVIIKFKGEEFPPKVITRAAEIAAFHSKAKGATKVEVDYCPVKNVKKPAGAKPGMVIYEHYQTAYVEPISE